MSQKPLVSVIMGVYKTKNKDDVRKCIDSVLNQTYDNIEFIICDDGSPDDTWDFLNNEYCDNQKVILIKNDANSGLRVALNNCLLVTKGKYIARHDDDDYSTFDRFAKQVEFLENNPEYDLVGTGLYKFDSNGIWDTLILKQQPQKKDFTRHSQHAHATTMFRKECFDKVNGYRIAWETIRCEDYDLFMRIYAKGMKGYNLSEPLYYYRIDESSFSKTNIKTKIKEAVVKYKGFKELKLPFYTYIWVLKPIILGLISPKLLHLIKQKIAQRGS